MREYPPEGQHGEGTVGLVGATVGEWSPPKVVPQQLREGCRGQHIGVRLYGAAAGTEEGEKIHIGSVEVWQKGQDSKSIPNETQHTHDSIYG